MSNKDFFVKQYQRLKELSEGKKPLYKDFLKYCEVHKRKLEGEFGQDAYSKLQLECGDTPNKLIMKRTPLEQILDQYGELVRNKGACPVTSDWMHAKLKPSTDGIGKVHGIRWKEMPNIFINSNKDNPLWKDVINILEKDANKNNSDKSNRIFNEIVEKIEDWKPNRKRIIEEGYKIELRNYLEKYFSLEEEAGESNVDLLINKKIPIEIKKDPTQSEYDRLLGQMIRYTKFYGSSIAVITNISSEDRLKKFQKLLIEVQEKLNVIIALICK